MLDLRIVGAADFHTFLYSFDKTEMTALFSNQTPSMKISAADFSAPLKWGIRDIFSFAVKKMKSHCNLEGKNAANGL